MKATVETVEIKNVYGKTNYYVKIKTDHGEHIISVGEKTTKAIIALEKPKPEPKNA